MITIITMVVDLHITDLRTDHPTDHPTDPRTDLPIGGSDNFLAS
jgi:hypothetical protein